MNAMEKMYPFLRFCKGRWKTILLATRSYATWHSPRYGPRYWKKMAKLAMGDSNVVKEEDIALTVNEEGNEAGGSGRPKTPTNVHEPPNVTVTPKRTKSTKRTSEQQESTPTKPPAISKKKKMAANTTRARKSNENVSSFRYLLYIRATQSLLYSTTSTPTSSQTMRRLSLPLQHHFRCPHLLPTRPQRPPCSRANLSTIPTLSQVALQVQSLLKQPPLRTRI